MTRKGREGTAAILAGVIVLIATVEARAVGGESVKPKPPAPPEVPAPGTPKPAPPIPPRSGAHGTTPATGVKRYYLAPNETHKGDLYFMSESVEIAGKQQGDVSGIVRELSLMGTVTGDVNVLADSADLAGTMGDAVRLVCKDLKLTGHIDGDLIAICAS